MKKHPNLFLGLLIAASLAVATLQGWRVTHLRESTLFYRWIISAAAQTRNFGGNLENVAGPEESEDPNKPRVEYMDNELFAEVVDRFETDSSVPDLPAGPDDLDANGQPRPKLVRMVEQVVQDVEQDQEEAAQGADETAGPSELGEGKGIWDDTIWRAATSDRLAPQRAAFLKYRGEKRLASSGTSFGREQIYTVAQTPDDPTVSMTNMFFGFRKMAANLLWLQVDKYWHAGHLHRMVPLMKTTVALDPEFVDAFLLGAWHLGYNATAQMPDTPEPLKRYDPRHQARVGDKESLYYEAIDFLKDGIRKNPRNYKLYFDLGFSLYELKLNDYAHAVQYLGEAMRYKHDRWVPRQLAIAQQKNGQYADALAGWKAYYEKYPTNPNAARFIKTNETLIIEEEADKAAEAGDEARANELRTRARQLWQELADQEQDPYALMRLRRMDALDLARQGRYYEATGLLDQARYETLTYFDDISDLMIKIKKQGGLPLYLSEKMYLARKAEADQYIANELKKIAGKTYELRDDAWYEEGYNGEPTQLLTPGSKQLNELRSTHESVNLIVSFRQPVVFKLGDAWYRFRPKVV